jgi:hypothetical protein
MHLLMNHSVKGVNEGYITRSKLLNDHLRASQQTLSDFIIKSGMTPPKDGSKRERVWPLLAARRIGDDQLDPTPPDPREGKPMGPRKAKAAEATDTAEAA